MKRIRIVQLLGFVLVLIYAILFGIDAKFGLLKDMGRWIFSVLIVLIGINLICKGAIISSSSTMWFANNLIFVAIAIVVIDYLQLDINNYIIVFAIIPIIPTLINLLVLRVKIYVKVLIINISIIIPIVFFQFVGLKWYWILIVAIFSLSLGIFVCRNIDLDKEKIDGKV